MLTRRAFQFLVLIAAVACIVVIVWLLTKKDSPLYQPIQNYQLLQTPQQLSTEEIDQVIAPYLGKSFWDIELDKIQANLTRLDWALTAEVKRKWPNLLYVSIQEQSPVARWNEEGLINGSGQVFFPKEITGFENLVQLQGNLDQSLEILTSFIEIQEALNQIEHRVKKISYLNRVWRIEMLNGTEIIVDSNQFMDKIKRFARAYPKIDLALRNSAQVYDLRYSNGFIVAD